MADTVTYIYDEESQGPRDAINVYKVEGGAETSIFTGEWADSSIGYDALKREAINALKATYPDIETMTLRPRPPSPPPVAAPPPPVIPPKPYIPPTPVEGPKRYIPKGRYRKAKSTSGGEFTELESKKPYKGFYIESYKGKFYAGKTPEENGVELIKEKRLADQIAIFVGLGALLPGLLAGFFKKKPTQSEKEKGVTKRNFIQDRNNNKIIETDLDTYIQAKATLVNSNFAEIDWVIGGPAEDVMFGEYPYEGAESKNKKTIQELEKTMPGISTFVTDYKYLVEDTTTTTATIQNSAISQSAASQTFLVQDPDTQLENSRKANFDTRK
jgi:hypothetical protein